MKPTSRFMHILWTRGTVLLLLGLAIAPWSLGAADITRASHPTGGAYHLYYIHWSATGHNALDEDYCADSEDGVIGDSNLLTYVRNTLVNDSPHWDLTGTGKVDLYYAASPCLSYADRSWIEVEFRAYNDPCGTNLSCAAPIEAVAGYHYRYYNVYVDNDHVDGGSSEYHQNINHEFGHVLGLDDPAYSGDCSPASVMHQYSLYGCGTGIQYPQAVDFSSVVNNVMPLEY